MSVDPDHKEKSGQVACLVAIEQSDMHTARCVQNGVIALVPKEHCFDAVMVATRGKKTDVPDHFTPSQTLFS